MHGGEEECIYRILMEKPEGKRPLGRPRHMWEDKIKMDLREKEWGGMYWRDMFRIGANEWLMNIAMNPWVPYNVEKFLHS
jgi:hypothetical protein